MAQVKNNHEQSTALSLSDVRASRGELPQMECPDEGMCHHRCETWCWRVITCGPLSNFFPDDRWPDELVAEQKRRMSGE